MAVKGGFALDSLPTQNLIAMVLQFNYKTCSRRGRGIGQHSRSCATNHKRATIPPQIHHKNRHEGSKSMSKHYIPVPTSATIYYEPQTEEERDLLFDKMQVGDMIYNKWVFSGL